MVKKITLYFRQHPIFLISVCYFVFRLIHLTRLPVFGDEAIYLDWAWRETTQPGLLFYSLYDAKQPLLMWFFGIAMQVLSDPFFAGRFVSVICGLITLLGIYSLGKTYFTSRVAVLASLLYIITPLFSFYDRQALMEAGVGAVGIWVLWYALRFWKNGKASDAVYAGVLLGVGFFIKSSALIFLAAFILISIWLWWKKQTVTFVPLFYSSAAFLSTIVLLLLQPRFWQTLSSNSRYGFGFRDFLSLPLVEWGTNLLGNGEIGVLFMTPVVFCCSILGLVVAFRRQKKQVGILVVWVVIVLFLQTVVVRSTSQRYLVSYLPPLLMFAAYFLVLLLEKYKGFLRQSMMVTLLFLIPLVITMVQVYNPVLYFRMYSFSRFSESSYLTGGTSGYGIKEAIAYIETLPKKGKIFVGESLYTGNPESAVMIWFAKSRTVTVGYLDRRLLGDIVDKSECLKAGIPVYFMSKGDDVAGLEKFLENMVYLKNPYNKNVIGIWKAKENCTGDVLPVQLVNIQ